MKFRPYIFLTGLILMISGSFFQNYACDKNCNMSKTGVCTCNEKKSNESSIPLGTSNNCARFHNDCCNQPYTDNNPVNQSSDSQDNRSLPVQKAVAFFSCSVDQKEFSTLQSIDHDSIFSCHLIPPLRI